MRLFIILPYYFYWHYSRAYVQSVTILKNFVWFFWHFFSIPNLARTLFAPFQRLEEHAEKKFDVAGYLSALIINIIMRCVGAIVRLTMIIAGLASIVLVVVLGVAFLFVWLLYPLVLLCIVIFGIVQLVS